ncbi:hypothetical protein EXN66_Car017187 [Channa argus]|uniref:Uncharacterized protein n=1 Tax=Channa argus TaxID=215402 RepID=A0A6G1QGI0_CHAAH|nr:hypothetical protein EXN66_Car017187 [Channa argus]
MCKGLKKLLGEMGCRQKVLQKTILRCCGLKWSKLFKSHKVISIQQVLNSLPLLFDAS